MAKILPALEQSRSQRKPDAGPSDRATRYPATPWSSQRLYRPFVKWSLLIGLTLGSATGAAMLVSRAFGLEPGLWWITHAQSHGTAQIFGFAGLFTMGIAFHVVPRFRNGSRVFPWPQRAVLWFVVAGVVFHIAGQSIEDVPAVSSPLLVLSGAGLLLGILGFAGSVINTLTTGSSPHQAVERWVLFGALWLVAAAGIHLAITVRMMLDSTVIEYGPWDRAMIAAGIPGFVLIFLFGVSMRAVSGFLRLKPMLKPVERLAFVLLNLGVGWTVAGELLGLNSELAAWGPMLTAVAIALFIVSIRILEPAQRSGPVLPGSYHRYNWFIRSAYIWLAVFAAFHFLTALEAVIGTRWLPYAAFSPVTHILTIGFITTMIIGMGVRMLPLFEGAIVDHHRALDAAWVALMTSVALRVSFGYVRSGSDAVLGVSGVLGLVALGLFAWAIRGAFSEKSRMAYQRAVQPAMHWRSARDTS